MPAAPSTTADLAYAVEFGSDPGDWQSDAGIEVGVSPGDHESTEKVTVRDSVPVTTASRRFGRVRVTMN